MSIELDIMELDLPEPKTIFTQTLPPHLRRCLTGSARSMEMMLMFVVGERAEGAEAPSRCRNAPNAPNIIATIRSRSGRIRIQIRAFEGSINIDAKGGTNRALRLVGR